MLDNEIQSRMDAYRGNPQALMQRYAQSQQLLDLLALQKLKSEKEAAMRQMQMGQPGQLPTVAQQREQELMGMAKQEVAQRVGQVAQQQVQQQQENLQRAAQSGIAQAPAPNMMPTKAMAAGGIVAFAEGGETGVKSIEQLQKEYENARAAGDFQEASRLFKVIKARESVAPQAVPVPPAEMGVMSQPQPRAKPAAEATLQVPPAGSLPTPGIGGLPANLALPTRRAGAVPSGAPEGAREGIAGAIKPPTPAPVGAPSSAEMSPQRAAYEKYTTEQVGADPEKVAAARRAAYEQEVNPMYAEQREMQQKGLAALEERMRRQQALQDPLGAWLAGAQGRTIGEVLGSAGRAGRAYQTEQLTAQAALEDQLQKLREAQVGAKIKQAEGAYGIGEAARKELIGEREKAATSAGQYLVGLEAAKTREAIADLQTQARLTAAASGDRDKVVNMAEQRIAAALKPLESKYPMRGVMPKQQLEYDREEKAIRERIYREFKLVPTGPAETAPAAGKPASERAPLSTFNK